MADAPFSGSVDLVNKHDKPGRPGILGVPGNNKLSKKFEPLTSANAACKTAGGVSKAGISGAEIAENRRFDEKRGLFHLLRACVTQVFHKQDFTPDDGTGM